MLRIGILTLSDRASRGEYEDLGGPAIAAWLSPAAPIVLLQRKTAAGLASGFYGCRIVAASECRLAHVASDWSLAKTRYSQSEQRWIGHRHSHSGKLTGRQADVTTVSWHAALVDHKQVGGLRS